MVPQVIVNVISYGRVQTPISPIDGNEGDCECNYVYGLGDNRFQLSMVQKVIVNVIIFIVWVITESTDSQSNSQ